MIAASEREVRIPAGAATLDGTLELPARSRGLVIFAHGSGSSRHSPRNRAVASVLNRAGIATLLFDLLTADEDVARAARFDIPRLAERLLQATAWARGLAETRGLPLGYFGGIGGGPDRNHPAAGFALDPQPAGSQRVELGAGTPDQPGVVPGLGERGADGAAQCAGSQNRDRHRVGR